MKKLKITLAAFSLIFSAQQLMAQEKPSELSKLLFNLEEMVDREDEGDYEKQNKENLNFFSTVINNDSSFKKSAQDTIVLEEEDLKSINKHLNLKFSYVGNQIGKIKESVNFQNIPVTWE